MYITTKQIKKIINKLPKNIKKCRKCNKNRLKANFTKKQGTCKYCLQQLYYELKHEVYTAFGGKCTCCGEKNFKFLSVDHINGLNGDKRISGLTLFKKLQQLNYPKDRYQLLCWNCNWAKWQYGVCPHQVNRKKRKCSA